ncbi:MAG TPA: carbohydrate ABC transporter permease [Bacilli bacterium]
MFHAVILIMALFALLPFVVLLDSSLSSESHILVHGYTLIPRHFSLDAYKFIFRSPGEVLTSYKVSIIVTVVGTAAALFFSAMGAYVMYRKDVKYRNGLAFYLFFTTLFNGGLAPYYILLVRYLHMKNSYSVLILSPAVNFVIYILILRSFIKSTIPDAVVESAKIDGANDMRIFLRIVFPLMKPALASIGLFMALAYWNDWWTPMMFVEHQNMFPLQYTLYQMLSMMNVSGQFGQHMGNVQLPKETFKLAMTVVATGPIVLVYPFVQKYFVKGITIGAVKG